MAISEIPLKFEGEKELINTISKYAASCDDKIIVREDTPVSDSLYLDLTDYASIVTIISEIGSLVGISKCLYEYLSKRSDKKIVIRTPFKTVEITSKEELSKKQIKNILNKLVEITNDD